MFLAFMQIQEPSQQAKARFWPLLWYFSSLLCFGLGLYYPMMHTDVLLGLKEQSAHLLDAVAYFYKDGDYFIATLIFFFSVLFPCLKYLFLAAMLFQIRLSSRLKHFLDLVSKWAMLDVFVVALIILNLKFDSLIVKTTVGLGANFFALSVVLLLLCNWTMGAGGRPSDV
jgi:paraquat-inducible protein A